MPTKIFLSYSTENKNKMTALKKAIAKQQRLEPIVIADRRSPRKPLDEMVKEGVKEASYIIPILTADSIYNQWVNQEIGFAEALEKNIYPIVEKSILNDLKGFIHRYCDLPHCFEASENKVKESASFRKSYKILLNDITEFEKIKNRENSQEISHNLEMTSTFGYKAKDIAVEKEITDKTAFNLRIKLFSKEQIFRAYYLFETDRNEIKWVGYTNKKGAENITDGEYTIALNDTKKSSYIINDNIISTIKRLFPNLLGQPDKITVVRFRGDKFDDREINFYYGFSEES